MSKVMCVALPFHLFYFYNLSGNPVALFFCRSMYLPQLYRSFYAWYDFCLCGRRFPIRGHADGPSRVHWVFSIFCPSNEALLGLSPELFQGYVGLSVGRAEDVSCPIFHRRPVTGTLASVPCLFATVPSRFGCGNHSQLFLIMVLSSLSVSLSLSIPLPLLSLSLPPPPISLLISKHAYGITTTTP